MKTEIETEEMFRKDLDDGRVRYFQKYKDRMTGKWKVVSVILSDSKRETVKSARKVLKEKIEGNFSVRKKDMTFEQLCKEYLDGTKDLRTSTQSRNKHSCNSLISMIGKDTLISNIDAHYVKKCFDASGKGPATLNEHLKRFKILMRWAYNDELLDSVEYLSKLKPYTVEPHKYFITDKYLEAEELSDILSEMDNMPKYKLMTQFLVYSGLRVGELAGLSKDEVTDDCIHVNHSWDFNNNILTPPKNKSSIRPVHVQPQLREVIHEINKFTAEMEMEFGFRTDIFFPDSKGEHIDYYAYNKYFRELTERTIGRKLTIHALRHTHCSLMFEQGMTLEAISERLGHSTSKITKEIYLHITDKMKQENNDKLDKIII